MSSEIVILIVVLGMVASWIFLKSRNMQIWIGSYLKEAFLSINRNADRNSSKGGKTKHVYVCLADHFEPYYGQASQSIARELVDDWTNLYKKEAILYRDSDGRHPQHTYFYPVEEYDELILDRLKEICDAGFGDVEVHLHHDNDTAENLEVTLNNYKELLFERHSLLRKNIDGNLVYGFIHGNWALDNSRPDGKWCGVDNELEILQKTGCVFDMTMPSAPSDTQTSTINSIYFAKSLGKPKSHDKGVHLTAGDWRKNELLMIQGPLKLNWKSRKLGLIPRIETGELSFDLPPKKSRVELWESANVTLRNSDDHLFIKLYTHGLQKKNMSMFYEMGGFKELWTLLENRFMKTKGYALHYVTAWEMYCKIEELAKR